MLKELRLANVSTPDAANPFLQGYLPIYHRRFAVQPARTADLHRPRPASRDLDRSLCLTPTRCVRRAGTGAHHGHRYQVRTNVRATHVMVEERVEGTMRITHDGRPLGDHAILARPERVAAPPKVQVPRRPVKPTPAHPWLRRLRPERRTPATAASV